MRKPAPGISNQHGASSKALMPSDSGLPARQKSLSRRGFIKQAALAATATAAMTPGIAVKAQSGIADVALVLAVDVSKSVNKERFDLQRKGIAAALKSPEFAEAISQLTVEIAVIEWSKQQQTLIGWQVLDTRDPEFQNKIEALAHALLTKNRPVLGDYTGIADGIRAATALLGQKPLEALREVIDVSGDGTENVHALGSDRIALAVQAARDAATSQGITINGLPIINENAPHLDKYYTENVIGGPGAFIERANDFSDFERAIRRKLILEIAGIAPKQMNAFLNPPHPPQSQPGALATQKDPLAFAGKQRLMLTA